MRVLVTGGAGFIGSHLVDELVERGCDVTVFDNLDPQVHTTNSPPPWANPSARFVQGDVRDYDALKAVVLAADVVFHQAAAVGVGQSQYQIKHYMDVNVGGTANLLDILANNDNDVRKLVVAASMSSYGEGLYHDRSGNPVRPPLRSAADVEANGFDHVCANGQPLTPVPIPESEPLHVSSVYSISKRDQEDLVLNHGRTYGLPVVALRYFNVYGARQSMSNPYTGVAAIFLSRLKNGNAPTVYEDGLQTRDFVSVKDIVRANLLAMDTDGADGRAINVGTGSPVTIKSVAERLSAALGLSIEPEITAKFRKGDIRHCFPDLGGDARQYLGYEPTVSFDDGIPELIEWAKRNDADDRSDDANTELRDRGLL